MAISQHDSPGNQPEAIPFQTGTRMETVEWLVRLSLVRQYVARTSTVSS